MHLIFIKFVVCVWGGGGYERCKNGIGQHNTIAKGNKFVKLLYLKLAPLYCNVDIILSDVEEDNEGNELNEEKSETIKSYGKKSLSLKRKSDKYILFILFK